MAADKKYGRSVFTENRFGVANQNKDAMTLHFRRKPRLALTLLGAMSILSACATPPPVQQPLPLPPAPIVRAPAPVIIAQPEPAPPPPMVIPTRSLEQRLRDPLVRAAAGHASLMQTVSLTSAVPISSDADLNRTMDALTAGFSPRLGPGLTSYGALVGAQNSQFVDSVRAEAEAVGMEGVIYQLYADPNYAASFSGASSAALDIHAAWSADKAAIASAAAAMKQQSYALQKDPAWKRKRSDDRKTRIAAIKSAGATRTNAGTSVMRGIAQAGAIPSYDYESAAKRAQFWQAFGRSQAPTSYNPSTAMTPRIKRALTLAALEALGGTGEQSQTWIENYMTTPVLAQCSNWSRLHTEQCVAAGHYKFEDAFCVAEHQLSDLDECLTKSGF